MESRKEKVHLAHNGIYSSPISLDPISSKQQSQQLPMFLSARRSSHIDSPFTLGHWPLFIQDAVIVSEAINARAHPLEGLDLRSWSFSRRIPSVCARFSEAPGVKLVAIPKTYSADNKQTEHRNMYIYIYVYTKHIDILNIDYVRYKSWYIYILYINTLKINYINLNTH